MTHDEQRPTPETSAAPRTHTVEWIDAGRDEPPENGYWKCDCGATFAPDGVDEYAKHRAAAPERVAPPPLDVERLAEAIQATILTSPDKFMGPGMGAYRKPWDEMADYERTEVVRDAEALAAEYARLSAPSGEGEPE